MLKKNRQKEAASVPPPTQETILAEAATLADTFDRVPTPLTDILPEAREMLLARGDVADLQARGYPITDEMFERVEIMMRLLSANIDEAEVNDERKDRTEESGRAREELLWIRERIALIGEAAGVQDIFGVDTGTVASVVLSMDKMLSRVKLVRAKLSDQTRLGKLIARAEELIESEADARAQTGYLVGVRKEKAKTTGQLKRMLYDQMRHISKQGLAAYPDDQARDVSYRLARFVRKAKSAKEEPKPEVKDPNITA